MPSYRHWSVFIAGLALGLAGCDPAGLESASDEDAQENQPTQTAPLVGASGLPRPILTAVNSPQAPERVRLSWSIARRPQRFGVYFGVDPDPPFIIHTTDTEFTFEALASCTNYYARITAVEGNTFSASDVISFRTICPDEQPAAPRYPSPANRDLGVPLDSRLYWSGDAKARRYEVYLGESLNPPYYMSTDQSELPLLQPLKPGARYFWKVVAQNDDGQRTSETWTFTAADRLGQAPPPRAVYPPDGAQELPERLRLEWSAVAGAETYEVYLATQPTPDTRIATLARTELEAYGPLVLGATYHWKVIARGSGGVIAGPVSTFTTAATPLAPRPPALPNPPVAAFVQQMELRRLAWQRVANADRYRVYFGTDPSPAELAEVTVPAVALPELLQPDRTYYWRVVALNAQGETSGALWSFHTVAPESPLSSAGAAPGAAPPDMPVGEAPGGAVARGPASDGCGLIATLGVNKRPNGGLAHGRVSSPVISADGRLVAFASDADTLVPGDTNGVSDVFVYESRSGRVTRVSIDSSGAQGFGASTNPVLSADGRYVAFVSEARLAVSDLNDAADLYRHDRQTGETRLLTNGQISTLTGARAMSADGRFIAFVSAGTQLSPADPTPDWDVYVLDVSTGAIELISEHDDSVMGDVAMSGDGRFVAYTYRGALYLRTRGGPVRVVASGGTLPALSYSGDVLAFTQSRNGQPQVIVRWLDEGGGELIASAGPDGATGDWPSWQPALAAEGRYVFFASAARNLAALDTRNTMQIMRRDLFSAELLVFSLGPAGQAGNNISVWPAASADGSAVAYTSYASDLVLSDTPHTQDVFWSGCAP